jgi:cell division protein FtsB
METISHCVKRNEGRLEGRATLGMVIILVVFSLLGWIYLTQASYVATTSRRVQQLEKEKARLEQENLELMAEIAELESVGRLSVRAQELSFVAAPLEDSQFLVVRDVPPLDSEPEDDHSVVTRWIDDVTAQFTAWAREGTR